MRSRVRTLPLLLCLIAFASAAAAPPAGAATATVVDGTRTVQGGGRFVSIPGFPGETIDRRLLPDVAWLVNRFHVYVTDGYSLSRSHQASGEHPRGLAVDVVPGPGGTWADLQRLAAWAEPRQDQPRAPFRWVGWRGDVGHGDPGHCRPSRPRGRCFPHLHLSWMHADGPRARPAAWVMVLRLRPLR